MMLHRITVIIALTFVLAMETRANNGYSTTQSQPQIKVQLIIDDTDDEELPDPIGATYMEDNGAEEETDFEMSQNGVNGTVRLPLIKIQTLIDESDDEELPDPIGAPTVMVQVPVQIENEWGEVTTVLIEVPIQITTLIDESDDEELPDPIGYTELEGAGFENSEEVHIEEGGYEGFVIQLPIQIQTLVDESDDEELPDPIGKEQVVITIQSPKHMGKRR